MVKWRRDWFKCHECKTRIRASEYEWRDYNLYLALKATKICEQCTRQLGNVKWPESNAGCFKHRQIEDEITIELKIVEAINEGMLTVLWELNGLE